MATWFHSVARAVVVLLVAGTLLLLVGCEVAGKSAAANSPASTAPTKLRIANVPSENAEEQARQMADIYSYLEKKLGVKVEPFIATDYSGVVEAMRAGHLDVAWYGPFSYVLAAQEAGAEAFVLPVGKDTGKTYHSYFITRVDTGINSVQDIKGRTFTFGDPASTSGHLIPRYALLKAGIDPDKDLKSVTFSGAHDATGMAVANGKVEAGAIWDGAYLRLIEKNMIEESKVKIIQKSDPIPEGPWAFRKDLPADFKQKMTQALLAIGTEAPEALKKTTYVKFEPVADSDYNVIRETAKALNLDIKKLK